MVRVPKLPLSTTASENCAPSIGALVDPDTGYPSLLHSVDDCEARAIGCRSSIEARGSRGSEGHYRGPGPPATRFASPRYVCLQLFHAECRCVDTRGAATQPRRPLLTTSSAKAEPLDQGPVAVDVLLRQVVQQPAALTDEQQQAT